MRGMDIILAFPQIVLVLLFVSMLGPNLALIVVLVALSWVPQVARVARGVTADVVHREYVESAEVIGLSRRRILAREILPNVTTPLMVEYGLRLTWSIALIAAISFLGFGIQPPNADWGLMINENRSDPHAAAVGGHRPGAVHRAVRDRHELHRRRASRGRSPGSTAREVRGDRARGRRAAGRARTPGGQEIVEGRRVLASRRGEVVGLVGESGSGKTTVALALLGHAKRGTRIAGGSVRIAGEEMLGSSAAERPRGPRAASSRTCRRIRGGAQPALTIGTQLAEVIETHGESATRTRSSSASARRSRRCSCPTDDDLPAAVPASALRRPAAARLHRDGVPAAAQR